MIGRLYIDGIDVFDAFGLFVTEQGYNGLIQWAPLKAVPFNDWHERDGIEPDLSAPVLDSRTFTLTLNGYTPITTAEAFVALLGSNGAYHTLNAAEIKREYIVRITSVEPVQLRNGLCLVRLTLVDDFPLRDYTPARPHSNIEAYDDYSIDGKLFTDYGVRILEGSLSQITRTPDPKVNLVRDVVTQPGVFYDDVRVTYKDYDATIHCLMRASTLDELWHNYDALLYDLVRPEARYIDVQAVNKRYPCYYLSSEVTRFYGAYKIWLEFEITVKVFATPERL